jgi:hypothetical protein
MNTDINEWHSQAQEKLEVLIIRFPSKQVIRFDTISTRSRGLFDWKTRPKNQFDHLVMLDKSIWTCPTWVVIFLTNHKIIFLISQIEQKIG